MKNVYADVVLAVNFCLDYAVLYFSARFLHKKIRYQRLFAASVLVAVFSLVFAVVSVSHGVSLLNAVLFLPVMCLVCFGFDCCKSFFRNCIVIFVFSHMLCGTANIASEMFFAKNTVAAAIMLFAATLIFTGVFLLMNRVFYKNLTLRFVDVEIHRDDYVGRYMMLCDSGNCLVDPENKMPVIIVRESEKNSLLGEKRHGIIEFRTASGVGSALYFYPDRIYIQKRKTDAAVCFVSDENIKRDCGDGIVPLSLCEFGW